jgi:hypothetical protein
VKTNWPDNLTIQQYIDGSLNAKLMHQIEKKALEDPFLADALEGYAQSPGSSLGLSILQRQLQERIVHQQENKKVFQLTWQRLSVAAAAAVLFISAGVLFWMNSQHINPQNALNTKQTEVQLTPRDSLSGSDSLPNAVIKAPENKSSDLSVKPERLITSAKPKPIKSKDVVTDQALVLEGRSTSRMSKAMKAPENPDSNSLSEVAVSGVMIAKSEMPEPVDGWLKYKKYIAERVKTASANINANGIIKLDFLVDTDGRLSNFKVIKGLTEEANALAVKIIQNGPPWKPSASGKPEEVQVEVDFLKQ